MSATLRISLLGGCFVVAALHIPECARIVGATHLDPAPASRVTTTAALPTPAVAPAADVLVER